ncbi:hypothetical protein PIROE2DRAFT_16414 [Piromyces sp. E2]|nr:hypothetical protein PIROE2DRAFT_16414 [Piromyces sp. E2]|eukprot:OUM58332.1 hypothetical protein PIROE2DRAFT_16414 [Piromyces sp. E2]
MEIFYILLVLLQLIILTKSESIEFIGFSALYEPKTIKTSTKFINLYDLPYEYDIKLVDLNIYNQQILNLTWVNTSENNPLLISKINSVKFKYGIKLLTSAFLRRYIDSHKSTGNAINNLNLYIKNLESNNLINFSNEVTEKANSVENNSIHHPEQTYNIIMRNKLGLFLRYNIPDRQDLKIGGISYSDLKYAIGQICDSFSYEDFKLNNIGFNGNDKIVNYLFLSPIGTSFDIENDVERYINYDNSLQLPIGLEHLISLAINDDIKLSRQDIINSIINTSTNTIFNYLLAEEGTVNRNIRNTDSFKYAYQYGSRYIESQASFISIGTLMIDYPDILYNQYKDKKWELASTIKKMGVEEKFLYDIKSILIEEGKDIKEFLPYGIYFEDVPFSIYENTFSKKESYYYLFTAIETLNIEVSALLNIVRLFNQLLLDLTFYDNAYQEEKSVDVEYFINHLKQIYNKFYKYYDNQYKEMIYTIDYKDDIKYIFYKNTLLENEDISIFYNPEENKFVFDSSLLNEEIENVDTDVNAGVNVEGVRG